ncbi:unnamed protein product [Staurois parvus]|uniref:Uncharacterized protein n=1 Tax=Staurois parvus TaxID=386267 RepID=A0ABN9GX66_9NEOB|nr:unnamed protein product [Staurois parvus]
MRRCSAIPRSLTLPCTPAMSLLQCPRQCNPARMLAAVFWVPSPARVGDVRGTERREI